MTGRMEPQQWSTRVKICGVQVPALTPTNCVTPGKLLNLSVPVPPWIKRGPSQYLPRGDPVRLCEGTQRAKCWKRGSGHSEDFTGK